jgi:hypothetical protein
MRNVSDKNCRENQNTHFMLNKFSPPPPPENRATYENVEKYGGARGATNDVTIWRIHVACWISKATCTRTHTDKYVILIAFPWQ